MSRYCDNEKETKQILGMQRGKYLSEDKLLKDLVINHLSDSSKVSAWDRLIRDSIRYGTL